MARIRTIKPEFWTHEGLCSLSESTHLLAAALLNYADDEGYFNANVDLVRAACCPIRAPGTPIPTSFQDLARVGYVRIGDTNDGRAIGRIINFKSHQTVNKAKDSRLKTLDITWRNSGISTVSVPDEYRGEWNGTGNREQGMEGSGAAAAADTAEPTDRDKPDEELREWLTWWNTLKGFELVPVGVRVEEPSGSIIAAWGRVCRSKRLRELLADRDAIEQEIRLCPFLRNGWFSLEKLFGGKNRDKEVIVEKLLAGGYRDAPRNGRSKKDPRGTLSAAANYMGSTQ